MNSRERFTNENKVNNGSDRPAVVRKVVTGGREVDEADRLTVMFKVPLTEPRVVHGHTIGGGTSIEALRRARRNWAKNR